MTVPAVADLMDITSGHFEYEPTSIRQEIPRIGPARLRSTRDKGTSV